MLGRTPLCVRMAWPGRACLAWPRLLGWPRPRRARTCPRPPPGRGRQRRCVPSPPLGGRLGALATQRLPFTALRLHESSASRLRGFVLPLLLLLLPPPQPPSLWLVLLPLCLLLVAGLALFSGAFPSKEDPAVLSLLTGVMGDCRTCGEGLIPLRTLNNLARKAWRQQSED